ncbi:MAG: YraN family protein [Chloroflexia bacterium]|nr:YraN family protein [Chloroflexia bacterium]
MTPDRPSAALGKRGEQVARIYLEEQGHLFVAANWRCQVGELDLVTIDRDALVFAEVKTRWGERSGRAEEAVSSTKAARVLAAAEWFLADHPEHQERIWRCDLIAVTFGREHRPEVAHYVNAIVNG